MIYFQAHWFFLPLASGGYWSSIVFFSPITVFFVFLRSKILFDSSLFFIFLLNFSFCYIVFLILSNSLSVFLYSSLSIFSSILNCLSGNSCISISLVSISGNLLCPFDDVMFSWFFMIPIALCKCRKCLHIWRNHHCFQTWSTDSSKESSSPPGGRTMKCTVALGLVKQDHMVAPSLGWHDVSLVQASEVPYQQLHGPWWVL